MSNLQQHGLALVRKGYNIIPITPNQKFPSIGEGWQNTQATEELVETWIKTGHAKDGLGIIAKRTPGLDLDIRDHRLSNKMLSYIYKLLGADIPVRTGNYPKVLIPCRIDITAPIMMKSASAKFEDASTNQQHQVEVLATGQQYLAFGIHPDTQKPYTWSGDIPDIENLPLLTPDIINKIFDHFEGLCEKAGFTQVKRRSFAKAPKTKLPSSHNSAAGDTTSTNTTPQGPGTLAKPQVTTPKPIQRRSSYTKAEMLAIVNRIPEPADYDGWVQIGMALAHQYKGSQEGCDLWDTFSQRFPKTYDQAELINKYPTFRTDDDSGHTMGTLLHLANPPSPAAAIVINKQLPSTGNWYDEWCFVRTEDRFNNMTKNVQMTRSAFSASFTCKIEGHKLAAPYILNRSLIPVVDRVMYIPRAGMLFVQDNIECLNSYRSTMTPDLVPPPKPEEYSKLDQFTTMLIPNERERRLTLSFMSYIVKNVGSRVNWAPLLLGEPGAGKTTLAEMVRTIFGPSHVKTVSPQELNSDFNGFVEGRLLNTMEEIRVSGKNRFAILDKMKPIITNSTLSVHRKGMDGYEVPNVTNYMFFTNYQDALPIDDDDRRYMIIQTVKNPKINFKEIYEFIENNPSLVKHWLMNIEPHPDFSPMGEAPWTEATKAMVSNTTDELQEEIQDCIDANSPLMNKYFVSVKEIHTAIDMAVGGGLTSQTVASKLLKMGWTKFNGRPKFRNVKHTLYIPNIGLQRQLKIQDTDIQEKIKQARKDYK